MAREVLPYAADAWYLPDRMKIGYEINFSRCFFVLKPMRTLEEIGADILKLTKESEGMLSDIIELGARKR